MAGNIRGHIAGLLQTSKRHTRYVGILALLAVVVAFGVTMGLRRNGRAATVTETVLDCHAAAGVAHKHNADCYVGGDLVCPLQERELHVHDDSCYDEAGNLTCGKEEAAEEHVHGAGCFKTVTVTVDEAEAQPAEATAETTADAPKAGELTASKDGYDVTVSYGADAKVPDGAKLSVKALSENSGEYKAAREAVLAQKRTEDESFDESTLGMAAVDITISDASGAVVEPSGPVSVSLKMTELPTYVDEAVLNSTLEVQHLDESTGNTVVETVATSDEVKVTGDTAKASFTVDSFSTFTLTWGESSATIHYGVLNSDGSFTELEESSSLDTSAASISLNTTIAGYEYVGAYYCESQSQRPADDGTTIMPTLKSVDDAWQYTDTSTEAVKGFVENGSHVYVSYMEKSGSSTPTPAGGDIPTPSTIKKVTPNGDGTYDIQLDIIGKQIVQEENKGANVLLIFDRTSSMSSSMTGAQNRFAAAKTAVHTLVNALNPSVNPVQMAVFSFDRNANDPYSANGSYWTTDGSAITGFTDALTMAPSGATPGYGGTNWEAAFVKAKDVLTTADSDPTYVIFLTDGNPTIYVGSTQVRNNRTANDPEYTRAVTAAENLDTRYKLYGVLCANQSDGPLLETLMTHLSSNNYDASHILANDATTLTNTFNNIAQHIIKNLGASDVSTNDGVTSLSSVSASVSGAAGAFKYYKAYEVTERDGSYYYVDDNGDEKPVAEGDVQKYEYQDSEGNPQSYLYCNREKWNDAPGASYSETSGVTWDLESEGTLNGGSIYSVKFTVWPSQAAYDLLADINNGIIRNSDGTTTIGTPDQAYAALDDATKNQVYKSGGVYYMKTNTTLDTTYTFGDDTYSDNIPYHQGAMDLDAEEISLKKNWPENMLDQYGAATYRDENGVERVATEITLTLTRGTGTTTENYLDVKVDKDHGWQADGIYISCGVMTIDEDGHVTVLEPGHDYSVTEPSGFSYYWDLYSDVYHPMVINGVTTNLILDSTLTQADNVNSFEINGKIYKKQSGDITLEADNYRRSNLNITKAIDGANAPKDTYFEYTVTVKDADATDGNVWFSAWDPAAGATVKDADWVISGATAQAGNTGYWYATNGSQIKFKIKAGWNVRFLNLKHDSTFSVEETGVGDGFEFKSIDAETLHDLNDPTATWHSETGAKSTGTIVEPNNSYTLTYTNKWITQAFKIQKVDDNGNTLTGATFTMTSGNQNVTGFSADTLKNNGVIESIELGQGVYCLTETAAPDGYNILENKVYFKIAKDGNSYKASICDADGNAATNDKAQVIDNGLTVQVSNTPGSALPMTGGPGTALFNILGSAIATAAVLTYLLLSRRTSEGRSWV